jgi:O6-methylguanine-DNA--protein-cysteine methyltransferase
MSELRCLVDKNDPQSLASWELAKWMSTHDLYCEPDSPVRVRKYKDLKERIAAIFADKLKTESQLTTALDQLEKAKKALEIIRDFPCIINRTGETHSMKYIAASTLKELEK